MRFKNVLCIVSLFSIMVLSLCFGAVVNAEEAKSEKFSYQLTYSVYDNDKFIYDPIDLDYRICAIPSRTFTQVGFDFIEYAIYYYNEANDSLHAFSNKNFYVNYTYIKDGVSSQQNSQLYYFYNRNLATNIPIFENTEKGLADAKNYLETGTLPVKEGYDIQFDNLQVSEVIDDVVNITWDGYILDPALHSKSIVGYKVKRNVFPFIILSDGESDTGWQPWQSLPHYIDGKLKNADFIFSPSEPCPYKNGFAQLIVDLWPIVIDSDGQEYQGQKYSYYFDSDGNLQSVSKPTPSLDPIYDPDCYFENFYCSSSTYDKYGNLLENGTNLDSDKKHRQYFIGANSVKRSFSPIREQGVYILCFFDGGTSSGYVLDLYSYGSLLSGGGFQFQPTLGELNIYFGLDNVPLSDSFNKKFTLKFIPYYSTGSSLYYGNASVIEINGSDIHPFQEHNDPADENSDKDREDLDPEVPKKNPIDYIGGDVSGGDSIDVLTVTKNFYSMLTGMLNALGQFPSLVARVFSFLPSVYTDMLLVALALVIILRILGR